MAQTIIIIGFIQIYFQPINKKLTRTEKQTYCTYLFIGRLKIKLTYTSILRLQKYA